MKIENRNIQFAPKSYLVSQQNNYFLAPQIHFCGASNIATDVVQLSSKTANLRIAQKFSRAVERAQNIVIFAPKTANGDEISAAQAITLTLQDYYPTKKITFYYPSEILSYLKTLPDIETSTKERPTENVNLAIAINSLGEGLAGKYFFDKADRRIVISHNNITEGENYISIVSPALQSTTAVIYNELFKPLGLNPSKQAIECLYTGLFHNTSNFKRCSGKTTKMKEELEDLARKNNLTPWGLKEKIQGKSTTSQELQLLTKKLKEEGNKQYTFKTKQGKEIHYCTCTQERLNDYGIKDSRFEIIRSLKSVPNRICKKADIGVLFVELPGKEKVSIYLRSDNLNLSKFVESFNANCENPHATGFSKHGNIEDIKEEVLSALKTFSFPK